MKVFILFILLINLFLINYNCAGQYENDSINDSIKVTGSIRSDINTIYQFTMNVSIQSLYHNKSIIHPKVLFTGSQDDSITDVYFLLEEIVDSQFNKTKVILPQYYDRIISLEYNREFSLLKFKNKIFMHNIFLFPLYGFLHRGHYRIQAFYRPSNFNKSITTDASSNWLYFKVKNKYLKALLSGKS